MAAPNWFSRARPLVALFAALAGFAALAYVLPAYSILRRLADRRDDLRLNAVQVSGTGTFSPGTASKARGAEDDKEVQADVVVSFKVPGRCRIQAAVPEGNATASIVVNGKRSAQGTEVPALTEAIAEACPFVALRSASEGEGRASIEQHLAKLGVDTKQTSLDRFNDKIVYVIGNPAEGKPQLWVYKDTFLPARLMYAGADGAKWDVRFRDFGSPVAGEWFPRVVEVAKNGEDVFRFTALQADGRAKLGDELFSAAPAPKK